MTDDALRRACRRQPWERRLESAGCGLSLVAGLCAAYGSFLLLGASGWLFIPIVFVAAGITAAVQVNNLAEYRSRRERAELGRRHGLPDFDALVALAEMGPEGEDGPDWEVFLQGHSLPHGGTTQIKAELWRADAPRSRLTVLTAEETHPRGDDSRPPEGGELALTAEDRGQLLELLSGLASSAPEKIPSAVFDGFPCRLAAVRHRPRLALRRECNLAGVPKAYADHPAPALMERLLALGRRVTQAGGRRPS